MKDASDFLEGRSVELQDRLAAEMREAAKKEALVWALERGSRSGRVAWQFAKDYAGRHAG